MPADYESTARALALPVSPPRSPEWRQQNHASWSRRRSSQSLTRSGGRQRKSFTARAMRNAEQISKQLLRTVEKMTPVQMALTVVFGIVTIVLTILFFVFSEKIFAWLEPVAEKWKDLRGGWLILWAMTFATAFPPVIGYSTCLTLSGFIYGFPGGWPIVASATVVGSTCSFVICRTILSKFVHRLVANDRRFEALSLVLKHDGLKLLVMIRLCPLPYSISNGAISTFPTVKPWMFAAATAAATPKLLIAIFIGSRLAVIAKSGEKMDTKTKAINWASIIFGVILGALTGWLIYKRTLARSREIEAEERANARRTSNQSGESSEDPGGQAAAAEILRDDQIDFLDREHNPEAYQDVFTDDEDDVFRYGDGDEEEGAISLNKQPSKR